jgi:retron-type reverse transcriptase
LFKSGKFGFKHSLWELRSTGFGKTNSRPITMVPLRDKIVQKNIAKALSLIYEPIFLDYAHGDRKNKSCHTAFEWVEQTFKGAT